MIAAVQGSKRFNDYAVFTRAMAVILSSLKNGDDELILYSVGPHKVNDFAAGFVNLTENGLRNRGKKVKYYRVASQWLVDNLDQLQYYAYLEHKGDPRPRLLNDIDIAGSVEVGIFQY